MLALDRATLARLLPPVDVVVPSRGTLPLGPEAVLLTMPAALAAGGALSSEVSSW